MQNHVGCKSHSKSIENRNQSLFCCYFRIFRIEKITAVPPNAKPESIKKPADKSNQRATTAKLMGPIINPTKTGTMAEAVPAATRSSANPLATSDKNKPFQPLALSPKTAAKTNNTAVGKLAPEIPNKALQADIQIPKYNRTRRLVAPCDATQPQSGRPTSPAPCAVAANRPADVNDTSRTVTIQVTRKVFKHTCVAPKAAAAVAKRIKRRSSLSTATQVTRPRHETPGRAVCRLTSWAR